MNEPHLNHPNDPQDAPEVLPARFGYICPNQFSECHEGVDLYDRADENLDIDVAMKFAQELADETGITVTVDVTDEDGEELSARQVAPTLVQEMNGPDEGISF